jgi:hypothetical protein
MIDGGGTIFGIDVVLLFMGECEVMEWLPWVSLGYFDLL